MNDLDDDFSALDAAVYSGNSYSVKSAACILTKTRMTHVSKARNH